MCCMRPLLAVQQVGGIYSPLAYWQGVSLPAGCAADSGIKTDSPRAHPASETSKESVPSAACCMEKPPLLCFHQSRGSLSVSWQEAVGKSVVTLRCLPLKETLQLLDFWFGGGTAAAGSSGEGGEGGARWG